MALNMLHSTNIMPLPKVQMSSNGLIPKSCPKTVFPGIYQVVEWVACY